VVWRQAEARLKMDGWEELQRDGAEGGPAAAESGAGEAPAADGARRELLGHGAGGRLGASAPVPSAGVDAAAAANRDDSSRRRSASPSVLVL